jgi:hypothetical protein
MSRLDGRRRADSTKVAREQRRPSRRLSLVTISYEQVSLRAFLDTLQAAGVTLARDVRERPSSRRKGFSKRSLSEALASIGIGYRHEPRPGAPRHLRHRLREDGNLQRYFSDFRAYLKTQDELLDELARMLLGPPRSTNQRRVRVRSGRHNSP